MGGVLEDASGPVACWVDGLRREDLLRYAATPGGPKRNALAWLVRLRVWKGRFSRATLAPLSSNSAAPWR
eukprot:15001599-Alexandrium_andersonii.AAC.1